jgi:hypothetical protein
VLFLVYYLLIIPRWGEEGGSMIKQHTTFEIHLIPATGYLQAYFFVLVGTICALFVRPVRRFLVGEPKGRLLLVWIVVVFLLMNNQWILRPYGIQPPHFSRGYLFFPLAVITCLFLRYILDKKSQSGKKFGRRVMITGSILFLIVASSDNLVFVKEIATHVPHPKILTFREETAEALEYLDAQGEKGEYLNILNFDMELGILIPAHTRHNSFLADIMATPNYDERGRDIRDWLNMKGEHPLFEKYRMDLIIFPNEVVKSPKMRYFSDDLELIWQNALWTVYKPVL